eukprot:m.433861 g.433861  ORF g.433861 m.433861 type:complete len:451 (+) comp17634_c0_seq1:232-1584(+)
MHKITFGAAVTAFLCLTACIRDCSAAQTFSCFDFFGSRNIFSITGSNNVDGSPDAASQAAAEATGFRLADLATSCAFGGAVGNFTALPADASLGTFNPDHAVFANPTTQCVDLVNGLIAAAQQVDGTFTLAGHSTSTLTSADVCGTGIFTGYLIFGLVSESLCTRWTALLAQALQGFTGAGCDIATTGTTTVSSTVSSTVTSSDTSTATSTRSSSATSTVTSSISTTETSSASSTQSSTATSSQSSTASSTQSASATSTVSSTASSTHSSTATSTHSSTATSTVSTTQTTTPVTTFYETPLNKAIEILFVNPLNDSANNPIEFVSLSASARTQLEASFLAQVKAVPPLLAADVQDLTVTLVRGRGEHIGLINGRIHLSGDSASSRAQATVDAIALSPITISGGGVSTVSVSAELVSGRCDAKLMFKIYAHAKHNCAGTLPICPLWVLNSN